MNKQKGSILAVTVGFALVFTMLGAASIYMSGLQSETQEKQILNHEAFWLAEAGINRSVSTYPPKAFGPNDDNLPNGSYAAIVEGTDPLYTVRSTGLVNNFRRTVEVEVKKRSYDIDSNLIYGGSMDPGGEGHFSCNNDTGCTMPVEHTEDIKNEVFFEDLFGLSWDEMKARATNTNPELNPPQNEIAWSDGDMTISGTNWSGSGILIVNGNLTFTGSGANPPNSFQGIIWVEGNFTKFAGNAPILGAIFVKGDIIKATGTADGYYSSEAIITALKNLGWDNYSSISWEENDNHLL